MFKEKGTYGYAKNYKNRKLTGTIVFFLFILIDVIMTLIVFQTRNTIFIVVACLLSLPFAKFLIAYIMCIKFTPLKKEEYERVNEISEKNNAITVYDASISRTEGMRFFPAVSIKNNNMIALCPKADTNDKLKEYKSFLEDVCKGTKYKYRVVITSSVNKYKKELDKIKSPDETTLLIDRHIKERLLDMGV